MSTPGYAFPLVYKSELPLKALEVFLVLGVGFTLFEVHLPFNMIRLYVKKKCV